MPATVAVGDRWGACPLHIPALLVALEITRLALFSICGCKDDLDSYPCRISRKKYIYRDLFLELLVFLGSLPGGKRMPELLGMPRSILLMATIITPISENKRLRKCMLSTYVFLAVCLEKEPWHRAEKKLVGRGGQRRVAETEMPFVLTESERSTGCETALLAKHALFFTELVFSDRDQDTRNAFFIVWCLGWAFIQELILVIFSDRPKEKMHNRYLQFPGF